MHDAHADTGTNLIDDTWSLCRAQDRIRACRRCVESGYIASAWPVFHGSASARLMVVGQAPAAGAAERPLPFSGGSGMTLRGWLARAGFGDGALHDPRRFYLTSLTKCFPGKARQGDGDRAPSRAEIDLCRPNLVAELGLVRPELILALGRLAIDALLPSSRRSSLSDVVGEARPAELEAAGGALVLPLPHPSGVSRWHNAPANRARVDLAIEWLAGERARRGW